MFVKSFIFIVLSLLSIQLVKANELSSNLLPDAKICGTDIPNRKYVENQTETDLDEFPWMALLEYEKDDGTRDYKCQGVLISKKYVLTSAHCVTLVPKNLKLVSVRLGEYNTETDPDCIDDECASGSISVPIEAKIVHTDYQSKNHKHDIALLRLQKEVTFSDYIKPICLPISSEARSKNYVGQKLSIAGWGRTATGSRSTIKLKLQVPVVDLNSCNSTYSAAPRVSLSPGQMCAGGEKNANSCINLGGGPLMAFDKNWYSVGVISFGPSKCGLENWPDVYTKVSEYMPWIVNNLKE